MSILDTTNLSALGLEGGLGIGVAGSENFGSLGQVLTSGGSKTSALSWQSFSAIASLASWELVGNSGLSSSVNFIGTTDAIPLVLKAHATTGIVLTSIAVNIQLAAILSSSFSVAGLVSLGTATAASQTHQINGNVNLISSGWTSTFSGTTFIKLAAAASGADAFTRLTINSIDRWAYGGNSTSWSICEAASLGSSERFRINLGGGAVFSTSLSASSASLVSLIVQSQSTFTSNIGIGAAPTTIAMAYIGSNTLTATNQVALYAPFVSTSGATSTTKGIVIDLQTASSSYTCPLAVAYDGGITAGSSSVITRGIIFDSTRGWTVNGTLTNRARYADNQSFTGTWMFNSTSTDPSQFNGDFVHATAARTASAVTGILYLPTCAGAPTNTPTSYSGTVGAIYDTTGNKLYIYNGGWKSATFA